jgi:hypothetical protein
MEDSLIFANIFALLEYLPTSKHRRDILSLFVPFHRFC